MKKAPTISKENLQPRALIIANISKVIPMPACEPIEIIAMAVVETYWGK